MEYYDGFTSLKKRFANNNDEKTLAGNSTLYWRTYYYNFFIKLMLSYFKWENLPDTIDVEFLEESLIKNGKVCFYNHEEMGFILLNGTFGNTTNIYNKPLEFLPTITNIGKSIQIPTIGLNNYLDSDDVNKGVIIGNNMLYENSTTWLFGFCDMLADIEQTIQQNRAGQKRPYILITDNETLFTNRQFISQVQSNQSVVTLKKSKNSDGIAEPQQLDDMLKVLDLKCPYLLDKLQDEKQRIINQVLTNIGINNNAVDKAERLVKAEATANFGLITSCIEVMLQARQRAVNLINRIFNLNITVSVNMSIEKANFPDAENNPFYFGEEVL